MTEEPQSLEDEQEDREPEIQGRCDRCKLCYGQPQKHNESLLRCPECDFPFGETVDGIRAIALAMQDPSHSVHINVYAQPVCYIWLQVVRDGVDLLVEPCLDVDDCFGTTPEWYAHELDNTDWESIISPEFKFGASDTSDFTGKWNDWCLQEGLCPGQRFLVEFKHPRWYRCSWEYEEYDVEYFWDIVMRDPITPKQHARAWAQWQKTCAKNREGLRRAKAKREHKRRTDVSAMYIRHDWFWAERRCDDMALPDGFIVALWTEHGGMLASGRSPNHEDERRRLHREPPVDDSGPSQEKAWRDLVANVQQSLPHLDTEMLRKLPKRW